MSDPTPISKFVRPVISDLTANRVRTPIVEEYPTVAEMQERNRLARRNRQVPDIYQDASFTDLEPRILEQVQAWVEGDSPTLILVGNIGAGKTHTAYAIRNELDSTMECASYTVETALGQVKADFDTHRADAADLRRAKLLILDDLGAERPTEWAVAEIVALIDWRTSHDQRTVFTTNLGADAIGDRYGQRTRSRIGWNATVITFAGGDRRVTWAGAGDVA